MHGIRRIEQAEVPGSCTEKTCRREEDIDAEPDGGAGHEVLVSIRKEFPGTGRTVTRRERGDHRPPPWFFCERAVR